MCMPVEYGFADYKMFSPDHVTPSQSNVGLLLTDCYADSYKREIN